MSFINICYNIFIRPIELLMEMFFSFSLKVTSGYGIAIIVLSLIVNTLILPLYRRADMIQEQEIIKRKSLERWVKHIKNNFKGDERFLMLQTYYRQNDYKPIYVLKGSFSLLLQIPFFIAGYHFLSNLQCLNGISFLIINDLGAPDRLLDIFGISINIMPLLMTAINLISAIIYTKGKTVSLKLQLIITALIFLLLLYNSPSGLVLYWLCNNLYSCIKNLLLAHKNIDNYNRVKNIDFNNNTNYFMLSNILITIFIGIFIPSAVIKSSPQEFMSVEYYINPLTYIVSASLIAFGAFVIWLGIFYYVANNKCKLVMNELSFIFLIVAIINYMFFGTKLGNISSLLQYDNGITFTKREYIINFTIIVLTGVIIHYIVRLKPMMMKSIIIGGMLTVVILSGINICRINNFGNIYDQTSLDEYSDIKIPLSKDEKNVIVLMLDRAIGTQFPYIIKEKPELKKMFDGFTYYQNTLSYGVYTNFGAPPLYGGYEYIPEMMNKRTEFSLEEKHDEALKVMPCIFEEEGYKVTVSDPPYAGYEATPDLSIYDDYPGINTFNTFESLRSALDDGVDAKRIEYIRRRNFFCFSFVKAMPLICQHFLYDNGLYNEVDDNVLDNKDGFEDIGRSYVQIIEGLSKSEGYNMNSRVAYNVLTNLSNVTEIEDNAENTFLVMCNSFTHEPCLLQEPDYIPALHVDNTEYDKDLSERYNIDGVKMRMDDANQVRHYQTNVAALLRVGEWLDYLKENGVYDNTRIIIVSDHGERLNQFDLTLDDGVDVQGFIPLLLVKDFDEQGFKTSDEFMTQADVPTLAFKDLVEHPVNPFTGNEINDNEKHKEAQNVLFSEESSIVKNNGNTFLPGDWYAVNNNVYDLNNWEYIGHH